VSQQAVERTLGKLLTDEAFRERFFAAPDLASWEVGLQLSAVELEALSGLSCGVLARLSEQLDKRICRVRLEGSGPLSGSDQREGHLVRLEERRQGGGVLRAYRWPGNVREQENAIDRAGPGRRRPDFSSAGGARRAGGRGGGDGARSDAHAALPAAAPLRARRLAAVSSRPIRKPRFPSDAVRS
jgi:hypothetical protein